MVRMNLGRAVGFSSFVASLALALAPALAALAALGCDKDAPKSEPGPAASAPKAAESAPPAPEPPRKLQLALDDTAVFVGGERVETSGADPKAKIALAFGDKSIEGETLVLNAARDAKMPKVTSLFSVVIGKKVKALEVHTPKRDRSEGVLTFVLSQKPADCSAVGFISKESAITAWPASGATAERFARGMAGPDLTRGSEGIRKRVLACDAPAWFLGADESVTWGLVFDLALAVSQVDDAGAIPAGKSLTLLTKTPVSGRKIEVE
ncbi:MAG: hypothetical protein KF819_27795 [Labilithrix sp.]|nr:hypothetical protein [Labilithrix sp.]